jgi:16S rRNA (guanine527-N7)-methyltransferase
VDWAGCAVAKALALPPVAAEWCLSLVRPGGAVVLWVGPSAQSDRVALVAQRLGAELEQVGDGFFVIRKLVATPEGFPRRSGVAKKRPLA